MRSAGLFSSVYLAFNTAQDILSGTYRHIIISPELSISKMISTQLFSKPEFYERLRMVFIDEAHCASLWGSSFRPDYALLGLLRGRFPRNVPFAIASATLPPHVLDDIRRLLNIATDAKHIAVTNARPNVALSVRVISHSGRLEHV